MSIKKARISIVDYKIRLTFSKTGKNFSIFYKGHPLWKEIKYKKKKFDPDMTIHTPRESPNRVYKTYIVLKNIYDDFFKP